MTFGIIGYGRFGKLWARHLARFGSVLVYDRDPQKITAKNISSASLEEVCRADILFLLVPISQIENCCKQIKSLLSPSTIVTDACSVKVYPVKILKKSLPPSQPIVATHPLFGPDSAGQVKDFSNFRIAIGRAS